MNESKYVDLHVHSTFSDGTLTPTQLVFLAKQMGLEAIALTDHDTIDGLPEIKSAGEKYDMEIISGIEFATYYNGKIEIHIVGLLIDPNSQSLIQKLKQIQNSRINRNIKMCKKLTKIGLPITYEELQSESKGEIITRAHYARLMQKKSYIKTRTEAFTKYISPGLPAYVEREKFTPEDCIKTIHSAGGVAILAHPTLYNMNYLQISNLSKELILYGLDGIEGIYSTYSKNQELEINKIAVSLNLKISGGSDFHGENKPDIQLGIGHGNLKIPYSYLENLRNK